MPHLKLFFHKGTWIELKCGEKLCFENTASYGTRLRIDCLKLPGCFPACIPWKFKFYSSSDTTELS